MLLDGKTPEIVRQISLILNELNQRDDVASVVLSTVDGLGMTTDDPNTERIAAVAGLMTEAVRQVRTILNLQKECWEIILRLEDGASLLFYPFFAGGSRLILTVQFKQEIAYRRLLSQTVQAIQQIMEN